MTKTTADAAPLPATSSSIRPTDWAWAQQLIADLQQDAALQHLLAKWLQAEAAMRHAELSLEAERSGNDRAQHQATLEQLIHLGEALQQLLSAEERPTIESGLWNLREIWSMTYQPMSTSPERLAELQALCFPTAHAA